jgi:hypothetical protein
MWFNVNRWRKPYLRGLKRVCENQVSWPYLGIFAGASHNIVYARQNKNGFSHTL